MNGTLAKAALALLPVALLLFRSARLLFRGSTAWAWLQFSGAGLLVIVVLTHICEALHWFPRMQWGEPHSVGHYLDFWSAVLGLTLFPLGYLLQLVGRGHA